jgi:site-specific DNA recombinase
MPSAVKRAAIYTRISADPQGRAVGVHDQARQCRELIAQRWPAAHITGLGCHCRECTQFGVPGDVYCDNDITASGKRRRPHYERLLEDIAAGRIDVVVAVHTDRLHRNVTELETYINVCEPRQVATHTIKAGELDLTTSGGRMVARMLGAAARHELERMTERQKDAKRRTRDAGLRWSGQRPFGYELDYRDPRGYQIPGVSRGLVQVKAEADAIRDGYAKLLSGVNLSAIARQWNDAGLTTPVQVSTRGKADRGGRPFDSKSVRRVLLRGVNAGLIEYSARDSEGRKTEPKVLGDARWEPIVSTDTWRAAKLLLSDPERSTGPGPKPRHLLTGVLICGVCGGRRFRTIKQPGNPGGGDRVYTCRSQPGGKGSKANHLSRAAAPLDAYVEAVVIERLRRPDVVAALNTAPAVDIPALDARRTELNAQLNEFAATPGITPQQLAIASRPLLGELTEVERQISEGLREAPLPEFAAGRDPAKVWADLKAAGNIERMRAIVALLLRVKVLPIGRGGYRRGKRAAGPGWNGPWPFREDAVEILPPDA